MTLTFPQIMPTIGVASVSFELERVDYLSPEAGGNLGAISAGLPRWLMRLTLANMTMDAADVWRAWLLVQRGPQRPFFAFDMDRQRPRRHRDGRPYNPTPTSWAQAVDANGVAVLTLGGLLPGQVVSRGDYVGFGWGPTKMALARAVQTVGTGAAGTVAVAVEPPLPPIVPAGATVTLRRAGCMMRLAPGETKLGEAGLGFFTAGSTISAAQHLEA